FAIVGCSDEVGNPSVRGDYPLRTVNGAALPYVTSSADGSRIEVLDDVFSLYTGNTFSELSHVRTTAGNGAPSIQAVLETGTYGGQGTGITFNYNGGKVRQSKLDNFTLLFLEAGLTRAYVKD
ncbi:MAG: hypothetical protein ABI120_14550, partial [Gemmatimonadaceae bacterium]